MNLLFIGKFYPKGIIERIVEDTHGKVGFSNHNFELSLIGGFAMQDDVNLRVLTAPMVYSYPHNNRNAFVKSCHYEDNGHPVRSIGFCNLAVLNRFSEDYALAKAIRQEIMAFAGNEVTVVVNTPSLTLSSALFKAIRKIRDKKITTALIIPDVPECMLEMNGKMTLKNRVVQQLNKRNATLSQLYDKYVYLTEAMNDFYHARSENYIVMEGLIDDAKINSYSRQFTEKGKEIILYSGTLRKIFGVMDLVEVFERGNFPNTELWICGSGEAASDIEAAARNNSNIKFFGLVSAAEARHLQTQATILANPRSSAGNYTKYSFPSKTIEYLMAGKSVIMNRLPGIPAEYDQFIFYPDSETTDDWIKKFIEIMNLDRNVRQQRNAAGQSFIENYKSAKHQCSRIIKLVSK